MKSCSFLILTFSVVWSSTVPPKTTLPAGSQVTRNGVITSPGYPRPYPANADELMQIHVPSGSNVTLKFTYFDVQACQTCGCDRVIINNDNGNALCGSNLPNGDGVLHFTNYYKPYLEIHFISDASTEGTGFFMEYTIQDPAAHKGETTPGHATTASLFEQGTVTQSSGVVTSPGYPGNYPANQTKKVSIYLPLHSSLEISFYHFDLQDCYDCRCDYLHITYFSRFCGSRMPNNGHLITRNTMERYLEFEFKSDATEEHTGFYLTYTIYQHKSTTSIPCPSPNCPYHCLPNAVSYRYNSYGCTICECTATMLTAATTRKPYPGETTPGHATTASLFEQGTVTQSSGVVTSPGYPGNYPANQTKKVSIYLPLHSSLEISFYHFDLQDCYDCRCDYLHITYFSRFCGSRMPNNGHLITRNTMERYLEFEFKSDATEEHTGFYLTYTIYQHKSTTSVPCPSPDCPYHCLPNAVSYRYDRYGCTICECTATMPTAATTQKSYSGSNSLLLNVLHNLETQAEALQLQAKSIKDAANIAIDVLQHTNDQNP